MDTRILAGNGQQLSNSNWMKNPPLRWAAFALLCAVAVAQAAAQQDIKIGVVYVCNGEKMFAETCNMQNTSDTSTCMIGHPDHVNAGGLMAYTTMTRGALRKLWPTCTQPSAKQVAAADAFQKRQQDLYDANEQKANQQAQAYNQQQQAAMQPAGYGQPAPPKSADEREMRRCVSSGRLAASCTGNSLLGAFGKMLSAVLPSGGEAAASAGPTMAGVYQGAGGWRLDFIDGGVLVNCSFLAPNQEAYKLDFKSGHPVIEIETRPKPLLLTLRGSDTITGPGPVTIDGVVAGGSSGGGSTPGHMESHDVTSTQRISANQAGAYDQSQLTNTGGGTYDATTTTKMNNYVPGTYTPAQTTFVPRRATCPALNLSTKGASTGIQTMQTDLLKGMFGGDKGPPTPPGIRMQGIFAAQTGFSVQFFPESAVLGCGPDAARAYPYSVDASAEGAVVKIEAPDHPLTLALRPDGSLDPGATGPYQVQGRTVVGQDDNDNFQFAPMEKTCNLAAMNPSKTIPSNGGTAGRMLASNSGSGGNLSAPDNALGNATLSIVSGFPAQAGAPNPLGVKPYTLLRDSLENILVKVGIPVPAGTSAYKALGLVCQSRPADCQNAVTQVKANAASAVRSDASGSGTFPGLPPGTYYLMINAPYNGHTLSWGQAVQLKPGANTFKLDSGNATPLN